MKGELDWQWIASQWVWQHPLAECLPLSMREEGAGTLRPDATVEVVLVGFGACAQALLMASVATQQFVTRTPSGDMQVLPVRYRVLGDEAALSQWQAQHYPFGQWKPAAGEDYLPLPPQAALLAYEGAPSWDNLKTLLRKRMGVPRAFTRVVMALEDATSNAQWAVSCAQWAQEAGVACDVWTVGAVREVALLAANGVRLLDEGLARNASQAWASTLALAQWRAALGRLGQEDVFGSNARQIALRTWETLDEDTRLANLWAVCAVPCKLQLMGYDLVPVFVARTSWRSAAEPDDSVRWWQAYAAHSCVACDAEGAEPWHRGLCTLEEQDSVRRTMAVQEHYRWNAAMLVQGYLPATVAAIRLGRHKDTSRKTHGNLTTWQGLALYCRLEAERRGCSLQDADVMCYDYQILDELVWMAHRSGLAIVKRP